MQDIDFGAGAVGLEFSAGLIKSAADIDIFTRPRNANALKKNGIAVTGFLGDHFIEPHMLSLVDDPKKLSSTTISIFPVIRRKTQLL